MRSKPVLVLAVVALAAGIFWLSDRGERANGVEPRETIVPPRVDAPGETARQPLIETPVTPAAVLPSETPPSVERAEVEIGTIDFKAKYADWSLERLEGAKAILEKDLRETTKRVLDERMKQGLFEELLVKEGEPTPEQSGITQVFTESAGEGMVRYKIAKLPLEE
ncbi:MAG: hypothetical protein ABI054_06105, partial [Planctomycetota bacterium]